MTPISLPISSRTAHGWLSKAWALAGGVSVRTKILGIVLTLTIVLGLGVTWQVRAVMNDVFIAELDSRGQSVASDLAARSADPILLNDNYALYQLLTETVSNYPDALYAFIQDADGHVIVHTFGDAGFPTALLALDTHQGAAGGKGGRTTIFLSDEGVVHDFSAPIFEGKAGVVHLGLTENRLRHVIASVTQTLLLTTMAVAVAGILAAILLTWLLTRPILALVQTTQEVGRGNLEARAPHWANDEIGDLADAFNRMVSDLEASRRAIIEKDMARTRLLEQLITAQEEERKRISRELHDGIGQALISLIVNMKVASQLESMEAIQTKNDELRKFATDTLEQVRLISRQLRPSALDDLGLTAALERYVEEFNELYPHIHVDLHSNLDYRLSSVHEITLYRIIQEAMTNAARHSDCHTLSVLVQVRPHSVQAIIEDDGHGFDSSAVKKEERSVGIHGMIERAELVEGSLEIESSSQGTSVYVEIPI